MNFTLTINGETPAELLDILTQLGGMTINVNTSPNGGVETHTMTAAELPRHTSPQLQSTPVQQPDKPKTQAPAKAKKPTREPAAAPAEKQPDAPTNPTEPASASDEPQEPTPVQAAPSEATVTASSAEPEKDPVTENKIRSLIMALMKQGKQAECKRIITGTGAKGISSLPAESYTNVWGQLLKLKDEVDANAST